MASLALLIVISSAPSVLATTCYYDRAGYYHCSWLSNTARIGLGIGCVVAGLGLIVIFTLIRRRRIQRANKAYALAETQRQLQHQAQYTPNGDQPYWNVAGPQAPPTVYQSGQYAPPPWPPSSQGQIYTYAPPPGDPPNYDSRAMHR